MIGKEKACQGKEDKHNLSKVWNIYSLLGQHRPCLWKVCSLGFQERLNPFFFNTPRAIAAQLAVNSRAKGID